MDSVPPRPVVADSRTCTKCGESKPTSAFYVKDKRTGRLTARCKACLYAESEARRTANLPRYASQAREKYHSNPDQALAIAARYRDRNREAIRERDQQRAATPEAKTQKADYRVANNDARRAYNAAYRLANADQIKANDAAYRASKRDEVNERQRAWRAAHPERAYAHSRRYKRANPEVGRAAAHRRYARIRGNGGTWTAAEWQAIKAAQGYTCLMCRRREPEITLHADHVIPICEGGPNTAANLQGLCKSCNSKKYRRSPTPRQSERMQERAACRSIRSRRASSAPPPTLSTRAPRSQRRGWVSPRTASMPW